MGYCVSMAVDVTIVDEGKALAAIEQMFDAQGKNSRGLAWVKGPGKEGYRDLRAAFDDWGYSYNPRAKKITAFEGEKLGDDDAMFRAIAPHASGTVTVYGEDGINWRWLLRDGRLFQQDAVEAWGPEEEI